MTILALWQSLRFSPHKRCARPWTSGAGTSVAPLGAVDVDAFENNARAMVARAGGLPIRVASKSLRSVEALRYALSFDLVAEEIGGDFDEILDNW